MLSNILLKPLKSVIKEYSKFGNICSKHGVYKSLFKVRNCISLKAVISKNKTAESCTFGKGSAIAFGAFTAFAYKTCNGNVFVFCDGQAKIDVPQHTRVQNTADEALDANPKFNWNKFFHLLLPQLHFFIAAVISALIVAIANIQIPSILGEVVNVVARHSQQEFRDSTAFFDEIIEPAYRIVKVYITQGVFTFSYLRFLTNMGERMAADLRLQLFESFVQQDIVFYDRHKTGELVNRLTTDVQDFKSSFKLCISQGLRSVTQIIGCVVSLYSISPSMTALMGVVVPSVIGIGTALGGVLRHLSKQAQHQVSVSTCVAEECLSNIRTVRAFAMEEEEEKMFACELHKAKNINELLGFGIAAFQAGTNLFLNGIVLGTLCAGGSLLSSGHLRPGDLMAFLASAQTIQRSLAQLSVLFGTFIRGITAGARVFQYMDVTPVIPINGGRIIPYHSLMGNIVFKDVCFSYPTRPDQLVLNDFSLDIPCGTMVALVGASGEGKSTVVNLLERFYDVDKGSITLDGEDIRGLDPKWLRGRAIGLISQEPVLFATSIKENIRYGRPGASDQEVEAAAQTANAHDFIVGFSDGYNTLVGERGVAMSGGQKQRIAIARALLKDPAILILDEATSALDASCESTVQEALTKCSEGRTVLVVAHRLCTIAQAHRIAVVKGGRVVELGNHKELVGKGGVYASLIKQQQQRSQA